MVAEMVKNFLDELPAWRLPSGADAMRLLERVAMKGIKFPGSLIMLSKVVFTLDGVLEDVGGPGNGMGFASRVTSPNIGLGIEKSSVRR